MLHKFLDISLTLNIFWFKKTRLIHQRDSLWNANALGTLFKKKIHRLTCERIYIKSLGRSNDRLGFVIRIPIPIRQCLLGVYHFFFVVFGAFSAMFISVLSGDVALGLTMYWSIPISSLGANEYIYYLEDHPSLLHVTTATVCIIVNYNGYLCFLTVLSVVFEYVHTIYRHTCRYLQVLWGFFYLPSLNL